MTSSVTALLTWVVTYIPPFLMSHPVIDILALGVVAWLVALVARLIRLRG